MKVYLVYAHIPRDIYDDCLKYIFSNGSEYKCKNNIMVGLYGWTTKKKIIKEFEETRSKNVYEIIEKDVEDDDNILKILKSKYFNLHLKYRPYKKIKEGKEINLNIISTLDEHVAATEDSSEWIEEKSNKFVLPIPIYLFNYDIYNALDVLGLVNINYERGNNDDMRDYACFNRSYGLTTEGHAILKKDEDQVNVLLYLFSYLF